MSDFRVDPKRLAEAVVGKRWSVLASSGLNVGQIGSWDASLPRDERVLVPVDVQALVVPDATSVLAVPTETIVPPNTAPSTPPEDLLPRPPKPFAEPTPRPPGVYLHWALPDGLTRGDAGSARSDNVPAGNPLGLPAVPDRWVVVRLLHRSSVTRAWVLESDRGDHHDLAGWVESGPLPADAATGASGRRYIPREKLTAVAGGDISWAATLDGVIDRFAFHDDLSDLDDATRASADLSYLVAGWWSDSTLDPFNDATSFARFHATEARLRWKVPSLNGVTDRFDRHVVDQVAVSKFLATPLPTGSGFTARIASVGGGVSSVDASSVTPKLARDNTAVLAQRGPTVPRHTLCHGVVLGVSAAGNGPDLRPDPTSLALGVGPTSFAAFGALLADRMGSLPAHRDSIEALLAAFNSGLVSALDAPGGLAAVDEVRHLGGFTSTSGGPSLVSDRVAEGELVPTTNAAPETPPTSGPATGVGPIVSRMGRQKASFGSLVANDISIVRRIALDATVGQIKRPAPPRSYRDVARPQARFYAPTDLAVVLQGPVRSFRHGDDGRFDKNGNLILRVGSVQGPKAGVLEGHHLPESLRSLGSGAIPPIIDDLLVEAVLDDGYRFDEHMEWAVARQPERKEQIFNRLRAETELRHGSYSVARADFDPSINDELLRLSVNDGVHPSEVSITRWTQPWVPLWCDWQVTVHLADSLGGWQLGAIDRDAADPNTFDGPITRTVTGRTLLAAASATAFAGRIRAWLDEENARTAGGRAPVAPDRDGDLASARKAADGIDLLTTNLIGLRDTLLGFDPLVASRQRIDAAGNNVDVPLPSDLPLLLVGGRLTIDRLRIVDTFGRFLDVPDSALKTLSVAATNRHPDGGAQVVLPPRFQRPTRVLFRFVDGATPSDVAVREATIDQEHPNLARSPIVGWCLPDHVDEALECFDPDGVPLGQLMHDPLTETVVWEGAPGRQGPIGGAPDPGPNPAARHIVAFASGLIRRDAELRNGPPPAPRESALSALLRAIDTTLWTVDPLGSIGTASVAGLVGRPIALVRATITLDVQRDLDGLPDDVLSGRKERYDALRAKAIEVRLGELTRSDDGLIAYVVDDDYSVIHLCAPEVLSAARASGRRQGQLSVIEAQDPQPDAIDHPYLVADGTVVVRSEQVVRLTLFMTPGGKVHCTSGVVPRKALALVREWTHGALQRLSPSFRVGPVLVDPTTVRLPKVTGLGDKQTFTHRTNPTTWRDDPMLAATQTAYLPEQPSVLKEGWIRVTPLTPEEPPA